MMTYLRNRRPEWTTWIGLAVAVIAGLIFVFYRQEIFAAVNTLVGAAIAALPDRILHRSLFAPVEVSGPPGAAIPAASSRSIKMSLVEDFKIAVEKAAENAALAALKAGIATLPSLAQAAANAVVSVAEAPTAANITVAVADILAAVEAALATPVPAEPVAVVEPVEPAPVA